MKNILIILLSTISLIKNFETLKTAKISFDETNIKVSLKELKKIKSKTTVFHFPFKNSGNGTLILEAVQTSCTCTDYKISGKEIEPNKKGDIQLVAEVQKLESSREIYAVVVTNTEQRFNKIKVTVTN